MTDRRESDRREEDVRLADAMSSFAAQFAPIDHEHERLNDIHELLIGHDGDVLKGKQPRKGMASKVDEMYTTFRNGGISVSLPTWSKILGLVLVLFQIVLTLVLIIEAAQT